MGRGTRDRRGNRRRGTADQFLRPRRYCGYPFCQGLAPVPRLGAGGRGRHCGKPRSGRCRPRLTGPGDDARPLHPMAPGASGWTFVRIWHGVGRRLHQPGARKGRRRLPEILHDHRCDRPQRGSDHDLARPCSSHARADGGDRHLWSRGPSPHLRQSYLPRRRDRALDLCGNHRRRPSVVRPQRFLVPVVAGSSRGRIHRGRDGRRGMVRRGPRFRDKRRVVLHRHQPSSPAW